MLIPGQIILILWIAFIIYWWASAIGVKKNVQGGTWGRSAGIRILAIVALILLFDALASDPSAQYLRYFEYQHGAGVAWAGVVLCAAGIAFAIWARVHLGRNWSGTPSIKKDHELVTSGPYRFVRHPIYTGMLIALIGSALVNGIDLIMLVIFGAMFLWRIPIEEGYMMQTFPDQYPEYKKTTKKLIPFVW